MASFSMYMLELNSFIIVNEIKIMLFYLRLISSIIIIIIIINVYVRKAFINTYLSFLKGKVSRQLVGKKNFFSFLWFASLSSFKNLFVCMVLEPISPWLQNMLYTAYTLIWPLSQWKPKMFNIHLFLLIHSSPFCRVLSCWVIIHFRFHRYSFHCQFRLNTIYRKISQWIYVFNPFHLWVECFAFI